MIEAATKTKKFSSITEKVGRYYTERFDKHGATAAGVDWNSTESQELRFAQLLKVVEPDRAFTINDYGCGYGALADFISSRGLRFTYRGFDLSQPLIERAKELHNKMENCTFITDASRIESADYTVASGIFNVKMEFAVDIWQDYILSTLDKINSQSKKGFAFNMLTRYSDPEYMRDYLFYADPCFIFDHCKKKYSKNVALLHDYGLYEFTIIVRMF